VLTDHNESILDLITKNIQHNAKSFTHMKALPSVALVDWGKDSGIQKKYSTGFDVVLGSDIIYSSDSVNKLFRTVSALLGENAIFLLSYVKRWRSVDAAFLSSVESNGFSIEEIPTSTFLPEPMAKLRTDGCLYVITKKPVITIYFV